MEDRKNVAYVRYSSDKQKDTSIDDQKLAISTYANSKGEVIEKFFVDRAKTGTNINRLGYLDMIREIENERVRSVYCLSLDRIHRDSNDAEVFRKLCKEHNILIIEASSGTVYDNSIDSKYAFRDKANSSERFSEELSRRVRLSKERNALNNEETGGVAPYGYKIENKKLQEDPNESPAVRLIFERYIEGFSYSQIISELKQKGFKPRNGQTFNKSTINGMLGNKKYCGYYQFKMKKPKKNSKFDESNRPFLGKEVAGNHKAIVTLEMFEKAQEILTKRSHHLETARNKDNYILNGRVFCSKCGSQMNGMTKPSGASKKKYRFHQCKKHIEKECTCKSVNADALEFLVIHSIFDSILQSPSELAGMLTKYRINKASDNSGKVVELSNLKLSLERQIANGRDTLLKAGYIQSIAEAVKENTDRLARVEKELRELQPASIQTVTESDIKKLSSHFYDAIQNHKPELVSVINECVECIEVSNDMVEIKFK